MRYVSTIVAIADPNRIHPGIKYLATRFAFFNKKFFDNKLTPYPIIFSDARLKKERDFSAEFVVSLNKDDTISRAYYAFKRDVLLRTDFADVILLHEMCHHATHELSHNHKDSHGPVWQSWMKHVGLTPPQRYQSGVDIKSIRNFLGITLDDIFNIICAAYHLDNLIVKKPTGIRERVLEHEKTARIRKDAIILRPTIYVNRMPMVNKIYTLLAPVWDPFRKRYNKISGRKTTLAAFIALSLEPILQRKHGFDIFLNSDVGQYFMKQYPEEFQKCVQDNVKYTEQAER